MLFYGSRFYDSYLNRWTQPDTIIPDQYNPQSWDRYSYVRNNPLRYNDPSGHLECDPDGECIAYTSYGYQILPNLGGPSKNIPIYGNTYRNPVEMAYANYVLSGGEKRFLASIPKETNPVAYIYALNHAASGLGLRSDNPIIEQILSDPSILTAPVVMLGANGPQFTSKTVWQSDLGRLDVENPNPGSRPGQIHFQQGNNKWIYDPESNSFRPASGTKIAPPGWLNDLLGQKDFQNAIQKALHYLGK